MIIVYYLFSYRLKRLLGEKGIIFLFLISTQCILSSNPTNLQQNKGEKAVVLYSMVEWFIKSNENIRWSGVK